MRDSRAEQQLHQGRCWLPSSLHPSVHQVVFTIILLSVLAMARWAPNTQEAFSSPKSGVLTSLSFLITIFSAFGQGNDKSGRVIYCKTNSIFAQFETTDLPVSLLPSDNPKCWVWCSWNHHLRSHQGRGMTTGCHHLCQKSGNIQQMFTFA